MCFQKLEQDKTDNYTIFVFLNTQNMIMQIHATILKSLKESKLQNHRVKVDKEQFLLLVTKNCK
jgi:hypothetical protein